MAKWKRWNPDNEEMLPRRAGCYAIYLDGVFSYVGQAEDIRARLSSHIQQARYSSFINTPWGQFLNVLVKYRLSEKYGDFAMIEKRLIRRLQPRFNKQLFQKSLLRTEGVS